MSEEKRATIVFFVKPTGGFVAFRPDNPVEHIHFASVSQLQRFLNSAQRMVDDFEKERRAQALLQEAAARDAEEEETDA